MVRLSDLPIEIIDKIIGELPMYDRLKLLIRLSKEFSRNLKTSEWWRKQLQLEIGPGNPLKYIDKNNTASWQDFYFSHRSGWSGSIDCIKINHRTISDFKDAIDCCTAFFDGSEIIFGSAFWFNKSRDLRIFNISTTKVQIIDPKTIDSAGWPPNATTKVAYFEKLLICCSRAQVFFYEIDISIQPDSMATIKRLTYDNVPVIDGETTHISISKDYVCFSVWKYPQTFLIIWNRKTFTSHTIKVARATSLSISGAIIVGSRCERVRNDGHPIESASYWTADPNDKVEGNYDVVSFGRENISYPYQPTKHEVYKARNSLNPKQILSKQQELTKRDQQLVKWKEEQPAKISLLRFAYQYELNNEDLIYNFKQRDEEYLPFLDNTGRFVALGKQSGLTEHENLFEIFIWDELYCSKEASQIRCRVDRNLGLLRTGSISFGVILAFLDKGIIRIERGDEISQALHKSSLEQSGNSISIASCQTFSGYRNGVSLWGPEPHQDHFRRDIYNL